MSVIRAADAAQEDSDENVQYVFTITDAGKAKRTRISEYRIQSRGGLGIKAMQLTNEDRGSLVGAFIVVDGDEILSITASGQVVRSPINEDFRPTGRSTQGVNFVTPKKGDSVAVVARSVESKETEDESEDGTPNGAVDAEAGEASDALESSELGTGDTIGDAATPGGAADGDTVEDGD